jgi:hypothetical protein
MGFAWIAVLKCHLAEMCDGLLRDAGAPPARRANAGETISWPTSQSRMVDINFWIVDPD